MIIELFCSKCNGNTEAFTIKNGNLICSQCALKEQEEEEENKGMNSNPIQKETNTAENLKFCAFVIEEIVKKVKEDEKADKK